MKKLSSSLLLLLSFVFVLFSASDVRANRAAAGDIAYKWVSDSTYLLTYTFYKDCGGATAEPATVNLCYYNTCNTDRGNVTLNKKTPLSGNGLAVQNGCSGMPFTTCTLPVSTLKGFRKWVYEGTVVLPSKCASWRFIVSILARNATPSNYAIPGVSNNLFSETTLNNIDAPTSSSPTFGLDLIQYMCSGVKQNMVFAGTDVDGDALTYTLIDPSTAADNQTICVIPPTPTSYTFGGAAPGTSLANNPFPTGSSFDLGASSGIMSFTPTGGAQQPIMTMLITKRRGTKVVGTMTRDIQFQISNSCTPTAVFFVVNKVTSSQVYWPPGPVDTAIVCPNVTFQFAFNIVSPDPTVTISNVTDNRSTFSATSSTATMAGYTGVGTNNVSNTFSWKPVELDEGTRYLEIRSEICKPGAPKRYRLDSVRIEIIRTAKIIPTDTMICFPSSTLLCGLPFRDFSWSTTVPGSGISGTAVGIATPVDSCTVVTPPFTTTYLMETTGIRAFCKRFDGGVFTALNTNQAEKKIVVVKPVIDAGPDTVMCSYSVHQLNANMPAKDVQPELTYKFQWTPGKWLDDSTSATPKLSFPPGTPVSDIPDSIVFYLKVITSPQLIPACDKVDTITVQILKGFYILTGDTLASTTGLGYLFRQKGVSDTAICAGQSISLLGWGDQRYNYIWNPAAGVSTPTGFVSGMTITPTATTTYSLTAARAGCRDSTKQVRIVVEPIPVVDIGADQTICFGPLQCQRLE